MAHLNAFEQNRLAQLRVAIQMFEHECGMKTTDMLASLKDGTLEMNGTFMLWRNYAETLELLEKKRQS